MTYQPVIVGSGLTAWNMLKTSMERQTQAFNASVTIENEVTNFRTSTEELASGEEVFDDFRLSLFALGAYDLLDDSGGTFFLKRIVQEGVDASDSLANKLQDQRYKDLAADLGAWSANVHQTIETVVANYQNLAFERAVGEQDETLRLAMGLERQLPELAENTGSDTASWYKLMGTASLRAVFETAFGLPSDFVSLDLDKQMEVFKDKAQARFGTDAVAELAQPDKLEEIARVFLLRSQIAESNALGSNRIALQLLGGS